MREIKFRAWDKTLKQMIPVYDIQFEDTEIYEIDGVGFVPKKKQPLMINTKTAWRTEDEIVLLQYTGLKDKNGKEIYEGDIVEVIHQDYTKTRHVVKYWANEDQYPAFDLDPIYWEEVNNLQDAVLNREIEVIGNIYENPELLERK